MTAFAVRQKIQSLSPSQRFKTCGRVISKQFDVSMLQYGDKITAVNSGRASCRSPLCPVCRPGQMIKRQGELEAIIHNWKSQFKTVLMLTFTAPHYQNQRSSEFFGNTRLRTGLSGALALLKQSEMWKTEIDSSASVSEATFGKNGIHAHYHILVAVTGSGPDPLALSELWQKCCTKASLGMPSIERGVMLQNAEKAASYLSKWSIQSEMAGAHWKTAKNGNMTLSEVERYAESGAIWAKRTLADYYDFMYRRRHITYSRDLKEVREAHKAHVDTLWSVVPIFSVKRADSELSCEDEKFMKEVLTMSEFSQESIDDLAETLDFKPLWPEDDHSSTPDLRQERQKLKEGLEHADDEEFSIFYGFDADPVTRKKFPHLFGDVPSRCICNLSSCMDTECAPNPAQLASQALFSQN